MVKTKYLDEFLTVFGDITLAQVVQICLAVAFLIYIGKHFAEYLAKRYEDKKKKDDQLKEVLRR